GGAAPRGHDDRDARHLRRVRRGGDLHGALQRLAVGRQHDREQRARGRDVAERADVTHAPVGDDEVEEPARRRDRLPPARVVAGRHAGEVEAVQARRRRRQPGQRLGGRAGRRALGVLRGRAGGVGEQAGVPQQRPAGARGVDGEHAAAAASCEHRGGEPGRRRAAGTAGRADEPDPGRQRERAAHLLVEPTQLGDPPRPRRGEQSPGAPHRRKVLTRSENTPIIHSTSGTSATTATSSRVPANRRSRARVFSENRTPTATTSAATSTTATSVVAPGDSRPETARVSRATLPPATSASRCGARGSTWVRISSTTATAAASAYPAGSPLRASSHAATVTGTTTATVAQVSDRWVRSTARSTDSRATRCPSTTRSSRPVSPLAVIAMPGSTPSSATPAIATHAATCSVCMCMRCIATQATTSTAPTAPPRPSGTSRNPAAPTTATTTQASPNQTSRVAPG